MIVHTEHEVSSGVSDVPVGALSSLAQAVAAAAQAPELAGALDELAEAARAVSGAELALVRIRAAGADRFEAIAVAGPATLAAELEGTFVPAVEMPPVTLDSLDAAP